MDFCNARSVVNKSDLLSDHVASNNIDLMFITETWLHDQISSSLICPPGYQVIRKDRTSSKGGGVMLIYKSDLHITQVDITCNVSGYELLCVDLYDGNSPIRFICYYIPPKTSLCLTSIQNVCASMSCLLLHSKPCFILGDFNLPNIDWHVPLCKGDAAHDYFFNYCLTNNLYQCINEPTHDKGNTLDLLFTNSVSKNILNSYAVLNPLSSTCDHSIISFHIRLKTLSKAATTQYKYPI